MQSVLSYYTNQSILDPVRNYNIIIVNLCLTLCTRTSVREKASISTSNGLKQGSCKSGVTAITFKDQKTVFQDI